MSGRRAKLYRVEDAEHRTQVDDTGRPLRLPYLAACTLANRLGGRTSRPSTPGSRSLSVA